MRAGRVGSIISSVGPAKAGTRNNPSTDALEAICSYTMRTDGRCRGEVTAYRDDTPSGDSRHLRRSGGSPELDGANSWCIRRDWEDFNESGGSIRW